MGMPSPSPQAGMVGGERRGNSLPYHSLDSIQTGNREEEPDGGKYNVGGTSSTSGMDKVTAKREI